MNKIMVFIPMYNCEKQITRVLNQFDSEVCQFIDEVLVVNNRSTDQGELVVRDFVKGVTSTTKFSLVRNNENYGLGGSHKTAFSYAMQNGYDFVVVLHGDDQGSVKDLLPYLKNKDYANYDSYLGARFQKGSRLENYSAFRTFGNRVYNLLFSIVVRKKIYDLGSGLNMYKVSSLNDKYYLKFPDNLTFNYCMVMAINYYKQNVKFFPISWREEDQVSNVKMVSQAKKVLYMLFQYAINRKKFIKSEQRNNPEFQYKAQLIVSNVGEHNNE